MRHLLFLFICCAVYTANVDAVEPLWIGKFDWAVVAPLNSNITFRCVLKDNGTDYLPTNHSVVADSERWKLQGDMDFIKSNEGNRLVDGEYLHITNINVDDKGVFLCHVKLECIKWYEENNMSCPETERWFKHGLNLNGPLYPNILDKYTNHFMIAGISSGSLLVTLVFLCLVYKFRFKDPQLYTDDGVAEETPGVSMTSYDGPEEINSKL